MKVSSILFGVLLSSSALAAPKAYTFDPLHSAARFAYETPVGWTLQQHRFDTMSGTISFDAEAKTGSVDVTIDANSINTGSSVFNGHMKAADLFDTERFPSITFKSREVKFEGDKVVSVIGDLTVKGVTKSVTLTVTNFVAGLHPIQSKRNAMAVNATTKIRRSEFGLMKSLPKVADEVTLSLTVQAFENSAQ